MLRMLHRIICRDKRVKVYLEACFFHTDRNNVLNVSKLAWRI